LNEPDFKSVLAHALVKEGGAWITAVRSVQKNITEWEKVRPNPNEEMAQLEMEMQHLQSQQQFNAEREQEVENKYEHVLLAQEAYWCQRSRLQWAFLGDRNTKFFHAATVARRKVNAIKAIQVGPDEWVTEEKEIRSLFVQHFKSIYNEIPETVHMSELFPLDFIQTLPKLTHDQYLTLQCWPDDQEIMQAVFALGPDKASGPDGLNARFLQTYWEQWQHVVVAEVHRFFHTGVMPAAVARSNMVLIPKVADPKKVTDFRPISVCKVIYKVISKILSIRLKPYISGLLSASQTAFTPGRDITDNVVLMREIVQSFGTSRFKYPAFCLKCDLSKAFDRLRWDFVNFVLQCYGFPPVYISWVNACVSSARFSILFNGDGFIQPSQGLRQGCAMSPYLF
jgi:Reverse transcriptase (RNA-dependent DNA polymerase)